MNATKLRFGLLAKRRELLLTSLANILPAWAHAASSKKETSTTRTFGDMVGLGVKFSQGQPVSQLEMLLDLKVRWIRDAVKWPDIEQVPGQYTGFSLAFTQQLDFYRRNNIGLVALLTLSNAQAYPGAGAEPFNPQAFGRFAAQVARLLQAAGVQFVLEIGNEPHNSALAMVLGGAWNGYPPSPWLNHYVRMVHAAVERVKALNSAIKVISCDDMWVLHYWFLEAGLPSRLNGFAVHPYTPGPPERTAVASDTDWARPFTVVDVDRSFGSAVRRLRAKGLEKLGHTPEIWVTEWGWAVGDNSVQHSVLSDTLVAYLPRAYILAAAAGVEVLCWFSAHDAVDGPMGLISTAGVRRDSYRAFKTMTTELSDYRLLRQIAGMATPLGGLQAYLFQGPQGRKVVAWSADSVPRNLPWPTKASLAPVVNALGQIAPVTTSPKRIVPIGAAPTYIPANWTDADLNTSLTTAS